MRIHSSKYVNMEYECDILKCFERPINNFICNICKIIECNYDRYISCFYYVNRPNLKISQTYCRSCSSLLHLHTEKFYDQGEFINNYRKLFKSFKSFKAITILHKRPLWKFITKVNVSNDIQGGSVIISCDACKKKIAFIKLTPYPSCKNKHKLVTFKKVFEFNNKVRICPQL